MCIFQFKYQKHAKLFPLETPQKGLTQKILLLPQNPFLFHTFFHLSISQENITGTHLVMMPYFSSDDAVENKLKSEYLLQWGTKT